MIQKKSSLHAALAVFTLMAIAGSAPTAKAAIIADNTGDFLPSFAGPQNPDLDVRSGEAVYNGSSFTLQAVLNGDIGSTTGAFYVWGVNRGAGTARFQGIAPGVLFDAVVIINPLGSSSVRDLLTNTTTALAADAVAFSGGNLSAVVAATLLPSQGLAPAMYTVNLWPRLPGGTDQISDFAPDNSNAAVTATPEPSTLGLLGITFVSMGAWIRRRRQS